MEQAKRYFDEYQAGLADEDDLDAVSGNDFIDFMGDAPDPQVLDEFYEMYEEVDSTYERLKDHLSNSANEPQNSYIITEDSLRNHREARQLAGGSLAAELGLRNIFLTDPEEFVEMRQPLTMEDIVGFRDDFTRGELQYVADHFGLGIVPEADDD